MNAQGTTEVLTTQPATPTPETKAANPSHKNAVAKHAFGIRAESYLYEMTSTLTPPEALQLIEKLIVTCARRHCWSMISDREKFKETPSLDPSLITYWQLSLSEVFIFGRHTDNSDHGLIVSRTISMIETVINGVHSTEGISRYTEEVIEEMVCQFTFHLLAMKPDEVIAIYWQRLMTCAQRRHESALFDAILRGLKNGSGCWSIPRKHLFALITELVPQTDPAIRDKVFAAVWENAVVTDASFRNSLSWAKLLSPVVALQESPTSDNDERDDVIAVCSQIVNNICIFAAAIREARQVLHQLEIPILVDSILIDARIKDRVLVGISVSLNMSHGLFYVGMKSSKQDRQARRYAIQIKDALTHWARKRSVGAFTLSVTGRETTEKMTFQISGS